LRAGGWTTIRLRVGWAAGATAVAGIGLGLFLSSSWRGQLTFSWAGLAVYVVTGLATAGAIGLWSAAATATARYLTLAPQVRAAQYMIGALLPTAVRAMVATFVLWWAATQPSITVLVLGLVNAAIVIVLAPGRIGRAVRGGRRLRLATSGAVIINPSAHRTRGRHRA
jgi:hypothetical protein